ncbi:sulfonate ABC transporter substrate-binding protein [Chenggangzhangella methanolivorans]|uniref:Putative aliphatic sulfonates-binding protein n=1 Tax=Chenggangzhangella methanolivorans TaxID=1437009 RepID=A0A9E6R9R2_9HYPH|nr:sulfonate ABC transporter substrate-binding protein [Chenggangzhangella methanolivorans]QZO00734.1 sulfonate ABC transporter substrate-binding protein [Chenggangzhangella methanolivorans]
MTSPTLTRVSRLASAAFVAAALIGATSAQAADRTIRIGFQKYGTLILLKGKGTLEEKLKPLGVTVKWAEFQFGPPLLEAVNAGAVDFGTTGEAPPIFAQAASAKLAYVANDPPSPKAEAVLVQKDSPIKTLADLKGKNIAVAKGSNAHYLLVKALEKGGVAYSDVKISFLAPADGRAAFESGKVDAWSVWDPFFAGAEAAGARVLTTGEGIVENHQFFLTSRDYAKDNEDVLQIALDELRKVEDWVAKDPNAAAAELSPLVGIPAPLLTVAISRLGLGVRPLTPDVAAAQQRIADTFLELKLLPKPIVVEDAVLKLKTADVAK